MSVNPHSYIAIEGVIGVGKTTLARMLQARYEASILMEVVEDNPFLPVFYEDRERYAFQTQLFFLLSRYHQQYQAIPPALRRGMLISDYTFAKDELFAWLNLKDDELAMYGRVHAALGEKIPKPNLIVFLRADHEVIMRRIALRDRPFERDMDPEYIRQVAAAYDAWLSRLGDVPVLTIDTNDLDYLSHPEHLDEVVERIDATLQEMESGSAGRARTQLETLEQGRVATFQQFHRELDSGNGFNPDLFFNYVALIEEVGEVATELLQIGLESRRLEASGLAAMEAQLQAVARHRSGLREELASLLAYVLKLANYTGIDLEQAYLDKMRHTLDNGDPADADPSHEDV